MLVRNLADFVKYFYKQKIQVGICEIFKFQNYFTVNLLPAVFDNNNMIIEQ